MGSSLYLPCVGHLANNAFNGLFLQVCIDLFLMSQGYMDVATLGSLPMMTGGTIYHYQPFNPVMDQDQLLNDLKWNITRPQVGIKWHLIP
jgi:hypothetical protein